VQVGGAHLLLQQQVLGALPFSRRKKLQFLPFSFLSFLYFINHILEYVSEIFSIAESFAHKALLAFNCRLRFNGSIN
jgi:hypothetical protein